MNSDYYYKAYEDYLWRYEEDGSVIALSNGDTIVYRQHLLTILDRLAIQGLPCFTALLVVLGAARRKKVDDLLIETYTKANFQHQEVVKVYLEGALKIIEIINQLPEDCRRGENEIILLQTLFKNSHNQRNSNASKKIIEFYRENFLIENSISKSRFHHNFHFTLRTLNDISLRIKNVEDLLGEMKNIPGVDSESFILETVESDDFSVEKLMNDLNENPLTFRVGSLIKYIWGGMNIPFKNNRPGNQPLGGFADITNKGNFDKLLPSEFANEEVVFLSRLANNEALYFQRELPPEDNDFQRVILIDVSLKNWGTIKTLSHAIMLAIAHHPQRREQVQVFLVGEKATSIKIEKAKDIITGLRKLSTVLFPVNGLAHYFSNHPVNDQEILLITSRETMQYSEMKSLLAEHPRAIDFWIHPTVDGEVSIFKRRGTHKTAVKSIQIPFKEIWEKSNPKAKTKPNEIFKVLEARNYPILFSATNRLQCQLIATDGVVFEVSKNGNLFQTPGVPIKDNLRGWRLIAENLPIRVGEFSIGENEKGERILLMFNRGSKKLILLNLVTKSRVESVIPEWKRIVDQRFEFHEKCFWYEKDSDSIWRVDLKGVVTEWKLDELNPVRTFLLGRIAKTVKPFVSPRHYQIFKRSRNVYINEKEQLIFSTHALYVNSGGVIKLDTTTNLAAKISATAISENIFEFPDGSQITHHRAGMLIFKSSNLAIPEFFIPSILNRGLAVASADRFAGAAYFFYEGEDTVVQRENSRTLFSRYVTEFVKQILYHGT